MPLSKHKVSVLVSRSMTILPLLLLSPFAVAVAPLESNFVMGMEVDGQRLNLYDGCPEGYVSCNDMLLVAPDLGRIALSNPSVRKLNTSPYTVKIYKAKTKHSTCKDGVTPCGFQGYRFYDEDILGFIDPMNNEISIRSQWTDDNKDLSYETTSEYLPLVSQATLINNRYTVSDNELNISYITTLSEVKILYGLDVADELKKEQISWIIQRSKDCGADNKRLPRTQAEKVCFIQKNNSRINDYFLWID